MADRTTRLHYRVRWHTGYDAGYRNAQVWINDRHVGILTLRDEEVEAFLADLGLRPTGPGTGEYESGAPALYRREGGE